MYCILDDLLKQVPEAKLVSLTDDTNEAIDLAVVDSAIADAAAEIDAYAASQYAVPFHPVPAIIKKLAVDITLYHLFCRRGIDFSDESEDIIIQKRYKDAVKFLENLAKAIVTIGAAQLEQPPITGPAAKVSGPPRKFSRQSMTGY